MKVIFLSIVLSLLIVFAKAGYHLNHNYGYGNLHMHGIYGYPVGRVWGYGTHIWHPPPKKHYFPKHYFPKYYEHHGYDGYGHKNNGYGHGSYGHGYEYGLGHKVPYSLGHFGHGKSLGHGYEHGLGHGGYGLNHKGYGHSISHGYGHETHGKGHNHGYNGGGFADLGFLGKYI